MEDPTRIKFVHQNNKNWIKCLEYGLYIYLKIILVKRLYHANSFYFADFDYQIQTFLSSN